MGHTAHLWAELKKVSRLLMGRKGVSPSYLASLPNPLLEVFGCRRLTVSPRGTIIRVHL